MPHKNAQSQPVVITFTIDPSVRLNTQGQRYMTVSVVARQGDAGQVSRFDMTNWNVDLPTEVDRIMQLLLGGLALPDFPNMTDSVALAKPETPDQDAAPTGAETPAADDMSEQGEGTQPGEEPSPADEDQLQTEQDAPLHPTAGEAAEGAAAQPGLF